MTLFIALSALIAIAAAQVTPYCPQSGDTPMNIVNDCNSKCQFKCGSAMCELTSPGDGSSMVSCGAGSSSTIAPFCPPTLDNPGPSSNTPCGNGCQYTCTGSAGSSLCTLTLDQATSMWGVRCGGTPTTPTPGGVMMRAPFCPTSLNSPGPSSTTPCASGCQYTCTGATGYAQCTLLFSASNSMWNVQCGNTTPFGSPQTNPPFGQTTTTQFQQSPLPQQTTSSGQFQQTPQPPIGPTQSSGPFVQPTQSTLPQFTTSQQLASMQCNIATICDPYVAAGGKQCTVATGAQCFCNLQGAVYAKTCPSTPATVGNLGGCTTESKKLCDQQCVGSQATCDCNPDGSVRGVKCVQGTATKDDTGDASSLGASLALVGVTLLAMQFN